MNKKNIEIRLKAQKLYTQISVEEERRRKKKKKHTQKIDFWDTWIASAPIFSATHHRHGITPTTTANININNILLLLLPPIIGGILQVLLF